MLQELANESENHGCEDEQVEDKGDDGKRHTNYVNNIQIENIESYIYLLHLRERDTAPETKNKIRRFKDESRPDGHHSPKHSDIFKVTLRHA